MGQFLRSFLMVVATFFIVVVLISIGTMIGMFQAGQRPTVREDSILVLHLDGVIMDGHEFLKNLRKYADDKRIKGVLVRVNSPGGVVGPSQEMYTELKRVREELQKPVIVSCESLTASGAYYVSVAANQIFVNPGTLIGSIGVIMEFANLQKLYAWAKIDPYVIKTGAFKDSGSPYRPMRPDEKALFQNLIDNVFAQFKTAVEKGRKLSAAVVDKYADGRVLTGQMAVKLGFADHVGTYVDALRAIGKMTGLGDKPPVFTPPRPRPDFFQMIDHAKTSFGLEKLATRLVNPTLMGRPLYLMPSAVGW